jgi:hypothetical protein
MQDIQCLSIAEESVDTHLDTWEFVYTVRGKKAARKAVRRRKVMITFRDS